MPTSEDLKLQTEEERQKGWEKVPVEDRKHQVEALERNLRLDPKYPEKDIQIILDDHRRMIGLPYGRHRVIIEEIRRWVDHEVKSYFHIQDAYKHLGIRGDIPSKERKYVSTCLTRLMSEGLIERVGRYGQYRKLDIELETIDFINIKPKPAELWLPFGLTATSDDGGPGLVKLYNGNIIVIAGEKNSGKSSLCYNIAKENMNAWDTHFFDSEAGPEELNVRLSQFDMDIYDWTKMSFYDKRRNWADVIKQGVGVLNIIDFMQCHEDFYKMGGWVDAIHERLKGAMAVIAVQKKKGVSIPRGGEGVFEKARLALLVSKGRLVIDCAKAFGLPERNPNDFICDFKIVKGCRLIQTSPWGKEDRFSV